MSEPVVVEILGAGSHSTYIACSVIRNVMEIIK